MQKSFPSLSQPYIFLFIDIHQGFEQQCHGHRNTRSLRSTKKSHRKGDAKLRVSKWKI